jgi:hypothetical protein
MSEERSEPDVRIDVVVNETRPVDEDALVRAAARLLRHHKQRQREQQAHSDRPPRYMDSAERNTIPRPFNPARSIRPLLVRLAKRFVKFFRQR